MRMAIARHFKERDQFYKENPKRVGKKIWDSDLFNLDESESGLHKKM
jgi:hypothetical protein